MAVVYFLAYAALHSKAYADTWFRRRFDAIDDPDYRGAHDAADFDYTAEAKVGP
jgi:hypothetical protein